MEQVQQTESLADIRRRALALPRTLPVAMRSPMRLLVETVKARADQVPEAAENREAGGGGQPLRTGAALLAAFCDPPRLSCLGRGKVRP